MPTITLDAQALARNAAFAAVQEMVERSKDLRPAWPGVLGVIYRNEIEVFDKEGAVEGETRWPQLSNNPIRFHKTRSGKHNIGYMAWKRVNYPGRKILELTGKLRRQVTGVTPNALIRKYRRKLVFGTDYGDYTGVPRRPRSPKDRLNKGQDLGGILDSGREGQYPMEPRTIFRITQASADEMADLIVSHITRTRP